VGAHRLTARERAALLVLLAEGRELTNAQMKEVAGFSLDGEPRRRLVDRGLISCMRRGRGYAFEITDDGAAACAHELFAERPPRAGHLGGALYAVLAGLGRTGTPLAELFPERQDPEQVVRAAYERAAGTPGEWVGLARLREELDDVPRAEVDAALERLAAQPGVHVRADSDRSALTDAQRAAAVWFGGDERHQIRIEDRRGTRSAALEAARS
jgi:hypothetical protein